MRRKKRELHNILIGLDESNHGRKKEIVVAIFSHIVGDGRTIYVPKRVRYSEANIKKFLCTKDRDLRFLMLNQDELMEGENHLLISTLPLVKDYFSHMPEKDLDEWDYTLEIFLDGEDVKSVALGGLIRQISREIPNVVSASAHYYPKGSKGFKYVPILEIADGAAHLLFRNNEFRQKMDNEGKLVGLTR
jgi:hypothetical protein